MNRLGTLVALVVVVACGGDDAPPVECAETGGYLPLVTGRSWSYRVTDLSGVVEDKTQAVGALEDVGGTKAGVMAHRLTTTKPGGMVVSWQEDTGTGIRRHKELDQAGSSQTTEVYNPYRIRVDETPAHLVVGAAWTEAYDEVVTDAAGITTTTAKTEQWQVLDDDEQLTVPAGTFCALRVQRISTTAAGAGSDKTYWFARNIGKLKETGENQTEELTAYTVP
jgi:hypothetical protein